jgi:hypothetical protein
MKPTTLKLAITCLALAVTSGVALAQVIPLTNPGFEEPNFGKLTFGFTSTGVPGWLDTGVTYADTGVENGGHSGLYEAYEQSSDDGAYQISSYQIQSGDQITFTWWAHGTWNGTTNIFDGTGPNDPVQTVTFLSATTPGDDFASTSVLAVKTNGLPGGPWIQYTLTYTNTSPADVGKYIGIAFVTSANSGKPAGSYSALDDFTMVVLRPGDPPTIVAPPASQTAFVGSDVSFTVTANGATGYQWQAGAVGSGIYTNLQNGGKFSGVTTTTLTITNVTLTNNADYVVVASNGNGSVTSTPPANLTVAAIIYRENFNLPTSPDQSVTNVGWRNDTQGAANRIFTGNLGVVFPNCAVYSYDPGAANEAYYATTATANGGPYGSITGHMAFPGINLATVANLSFNVDLAGAFNGASVHSFIAVQMNFGNWYVSTSELLPQSTSQSFVTHALTFNPSASAWNQLTVSGNGSVNTTNPVIGSAATANLTGYITGVGIVCIHDGGSTVNFDNYTVLGAIPPTALPVINSPPFGRTNYTGTMATLNVAATTNGTTAGLTYQWRAGTVGSGVFANLSDGGQFSGTTSSTLVISNVTSAANTKDYVVVVTDGAGSVTSAPPARLTVVDSVPLLTANTTIYPDAATEFSAATASVHAGNHNTLHLTASFTGSQPISYQWRVSPNADGSGAVSKAGATSSTLTLSNPQESDTGYYSLQASNSVSTTVINSAWVQLTVLPVSTALIKWSSPVAINGLTAAQILGLPGTFLEAASFGAAAAVTVQVGGTDFVFDNTGLAATVGGGVGNKTGVYSGPSTGDANLDAVLNVCVENGGGSAITLFNLTPGQMYSVQLFAINDVAGALRQANFSDPLDAADVSPSFAMGDNVYVVGTFVATDTFQAITENEADGHGYMSTVVVRAVSPTPTLSIQRAGSNLQVDYADGILLEATNVTGPWTTNTSTTPYTFAPTGAKRFFRVQAP